MIGARNARRTKTLWSTILEVKLMDGRARPIRQPLIRLDPTSILVLVVTPDLLLIVPLRLGPVVTPDLLLIIPLRQRLVVTAGLEKRAAPGKLGVPGTIIAHSDG